MKQLVENMIESINGLFLHRWDILPVQTSRGAILQAYCSTRDAVQDLVRSHVKGDVVSANCFGSRWFTVSDTFRVGSYLMVPGTEACTELVIDLDGESHGKAACFEAAQEIACRMEEVRLQCLLEVSGSGTGWHLRLLMEEPVPAHKLRSLGQLLTSGIDAEVFPKSVSVSEGEFGSLVWLPFWCEAVSKGNRFVSVDTFACYVPRPHIVYRHSYEELAVALEELSRFAKKDTFVTTADRPRKVVSPQIRASISLTPSITRILEAWVLHAIDKVQGGEGRHDVAVRLAMRLRHNRISESGALAVMRVFQDAVSGLRSHEFSWNESKEVVRHAYQRRTPQDYDHSVAAELHRERWKEIWS